MRFHDSPASLLLLTGIFLGLGFPLGKLASDAGVSPVIWSWLISAGSACCLSLICLWQRLGLPSGMQALRYFVILGLISLVVPNLITFIVIPELGSGFTGLMFTLSPVFTLAMSMLWRVQVPTRLGILGVAIGFAGAVLVAGTRGEVGQAASLLWVVLGLCIPLSLAVGNLYRSLAWPMGSSALALATGTNLAATAWLSSVIVLLPDVELPGGLIDNASLSLLAVAAATAMFTLFFRLQQVGGPTYLSQIGYVAAAVALICGTVFLNERYSAITWLGAAVTAVGVAMSIAAQVRGLQQPRASTQERD